MFVITNPSVEKRNTVQLCLVVTRRPLDVTIDQESGVRGLQARVTLNELLPNIPTDPTKNI